MKETYPSGATRNKLAIRYDLLRPEFIAGMAKVMHEGAQAHGERNWEMGGEEMIDTTVNHLTNHLVEWLRGDRSEPHLPKVAVNAMMLYFYSQKEFLHDRGATEGDQPEAGCDGGDLANTMRDFQKAIEATRGFINASTIGG